MKYVRRYFMSFLCYACLLYLVKKVATLEASKNKGGTKVNFG